MTNETSQTITIDGTEYKFDEMTDTQKILVTHCFDIEKKIAATEFQLQQLQVGKQAFSNMLKQTLEPSSEPAQKPAT